MKQLKAACIALLAAYALCTTVVSRDLFSIKTALSTPEYDSVSCSISVAAGEVLEFSARDLERRLALAEGELGGITITSLPHTTQGGLYLDGVDVEAYEFVDREGLDRLCFVPGDSAGAASLTFLPRSREAVATSLSIQILSSPNQPPQIEDGSLETRQNVAKSGTISAVDPEGGSVTLQLIQKPQKGTVTLEGMRYTYQPYKDMSGSDTFTICAVDNQSAYSREATVHVQIDRNAEGFAYADMKTHPSNYAALMLQEKGVLTGEKVGGTWLFQPDRQVNRGEYVVMLLAATGMEHTVTPTVNTGLPGDTSIPAWLKPYVKAAVACGILPEGQAFAWNEIPTRAEAVLLCDRAANITDVKDYGLELPDLEAIPDWALPSYKDLAAYRMLDLHDGHAHPDRALDNSYAADLIWQLYKHCNR